MENNKAKLTPKEYAKYLISDNGGTFSATQFVNSCISDLAKDGYADTNKHQLRFFINVLFELEKKYPKSVQ